MTGHKIVDNIVGRKVATAGRKAEVNDAIGTDQAQPGESVAYAYLRDGILDGEFMPNERLIETDLAERIRVSRTAIRSALSHLEQDGLVVRERHRGARVRRVTEDEAIEILQVRAALEALSASQAAVKATADDITRMRSLLAEMADFHSRGEVAKASGGNARLHYEIIAVAGNQTVARLIAGLRAQMVRFSFRTGLVPGRPAQSLAEHAAIIEAIAMGDGDAAAAAMRKHLSNVQGAVHQTSAWDSRNRHRSLDSMVGDRV